MKRSVWRAFVVAASMAFFVMAAVIGTGRSEAADAALPRASAPATMLPFPRSERAHAVWASSACLRDCGAYCAWGQTQCLARDTQGQCLKLTDDCDRYCQRSCRTSGGPWLPLDF